MKRVDFDPNGERNLQNRGKSGYVRISWEEALDLVAGEIKRIKRALRPRRDGGVARLAPHLGQYRLLSLGAVPLPQRGRLHATSITIPIQWEGWYWGAVHHWGYTLRVGQSETYGTVEDCLQNCDMIVFWAADPETTCGSYGAQEGTVRRQWLKNPKLGIKVVHVDPYYNASAQFLPGKWFAPRPTTSVAMAMAIAYVWIKEGLYDKDYVDTPHRRLRQVEGLPHRRGGRHRRRLPNGRRRRPACRPRTCARWRANGAGSASISRPAAGATATAAPAATRPASSGRA